MSTGEAALRAAALSGPEDREEWGSGEWDNEAERGSAIRKQRAEAEWAARSSTGLGVRGDACSDEAEAECILPARRSAEVTEVPAGKPCKACPGPGPEGP